MAQSKISINPLIDTKTGIFCHLLRIDSVSIIIDCGINQDFDYSLYYPIMDIIKNAECILLTSFDLQHMGAIGLFKDSQIFCTIPTAVLGKLVLDELNHVLGDRVINFFSPKQIKFSQPFKIKDIEITTYNAGFIIGNSIFKINKDLESVIVSYNFNHRKENFLDGFSYLNIENSSIFLTNTSYISVPAYSLKSRDDKIHSLISNCKGTVIFVISYQRLLELLCILGKYNLTIVSKNAKVFLDRIKSMAEWCGSKSIDIIPFLNINFSKVNDLSDQKIVVLVNEYYNEGYIGAVINKFNNENNMLVFVDQLDSNISNINFKNIKIYEYCYKEKQPTIITEEIEVQENEDEDNEISHWSKEKSTFFVTGTLERKDCFPYIKRRRQNNEYGEEVRFKFEKKVEETEIKAPTNIEVEELEEKRLVSVGINPLISVSNIVLYGISDYLSFKTTCEGSNCKSLVIAEDSSDNAKFLSSYFNFCRFSIKSYILNNIVSFIPSDLAKKIIMSENVMNQEFYRLCDKSLAHFKARREDDQLEFIGSVDPVLFGNINIENVAKSLIENGFHVKSQKDVLLVNNEMKIEFLTNKFILSTSKNSLLIAIREILSKYVGFI